jgi:methylenetetrahydrofolate reductase (NADPH)
MLESVHLQRVSETEASSRSRRCRLEDHLGAEFLPALVGEVDAFGAPLARRGLQRSTEELLDLGLPGVVDRTRLMSVGVRTGVGQSLRYLKKNKASLTLMFAPGGYDPTKLLNDIAAKADELNVSGIHSFTFNATADTAKWANAILDQQV